MRILTTTIALFAACAGEPQAARGPAVRLAAGASDTIIVNSRRPTLLAIRALDAAGRAVAGAPIRYEWVDGAPLPVTTTGEVTCTRSGDHAVRALLGSLAARVLVRCRPVEYVRIPGPVQFILGDSTMSQPATLPVAAYGADGRQVALFDAQLRVEDSGVATPVGLTLHPRSRGITLTSVTVGDRSAAMGVHIYQRVSTLAALDTLLRVPPNQRLFAVPLRLERGGLRRQRLPPGGWMLAMLPEEDDDPHGIRVRVEGAACKANLLNAPRRFGCEAGPGATIGVYRAFGSRDSSVATGYLLVRWLFK